MEGDREVTDETPRASSKRRRTDHVEDHERRSHDRSVSDRSRPSQATQSSNLSLWRQQNRMAREHRYAAATLTQLDRDSLDDDLRALLRGLGAAANGQAILPTAFLTELKRHANEDVDFDDPHLHSAAGLDLSWRETSTIVQNARLCLLRNDHEIGWNSYVHGPMLALACSLFGRMGGAAADHVVAPVSLAHVPPKAYLLPAGNQIRKKMVDLGLVIQPHHASDLARFYHGRSFPEFRDGDDCTSWNPSIAEQIASTPLVISVETKRAEEKGAEAALQLGTWGTAQLRRLLELRQSAHASPSSSPAAGPPTSTVVGRIDLPQIKIQGASWSLMLLGGEYDPRAADVDDSLRVTLYAGHLLGDVTTYTGFFKVLACLRMMIEWTQTSYRPWLSQWVGLSSP
jgi:hypothetical protein